MPSLAAFAQVDATSEATLSFLHDTDPQPDLVVTLAETIQHLANHANLLALNAALETARAAESGHDFNAVVKDARSLAKRASDAARLATQIAARR